MFRLIFVDDEAIIRNGISKVVPWGKNGFELKGLFEHGQQALDYIKDNPVDVVITDINMPKMDGLTLSKILSDQYPRIMVLLLTGYDDFQYAQSAVKNQVREFLLKPITAEELNDVLHVVYKELSHSREQELAQEEMKEKLKESFPLLKERFLNRLVSGKFKLENFHRRRDYFEWPDLEKLYEVTLIGIPESWDELEKLTLQEHIKHILGKWDDAFFNNHDNLVLIFQGTDRQDMKNRIIKDAEKIFHYGASQDREQVSIGCGDIVDSWDQLRDSYRGAVNAVDYSRVLGFTQILFIEDVRDAGKIIPETFRSKIKALLESLKEGTKGSSLEALSQVFSYLEEHYLSQEEASSYYSRIHFHLQNFLIEMGILTDEDPFFPQRPQYYSTLNVARDNFIKYIGEIEKRIESRRNDVIHSRMDKAKEIIANRFKDHKFSLQDICSELYLSVSQFSFIFKEGTGQTFVEYLTSYRIEQAKKLLKTTDMKAYEIAESVGYQDSRYFSIIFKKQTGVTATEYRNRLEE